MKVGIKGKGAEIKWIDPKDIVIGEITLEQHLKDFNKLVQDHDTLKSRLDKYDEVFKQNINDFLKGVNSL